MSERRVISQRDFTNAIEAVCTELGTQDRDVKTAVGTALRRVFEVAG